MKKGSSLAFRRPEWILNHNIILEKYFELLNKNGIAPTASKIAEITGLTSRTCYKHYEQLELDDFSTEFKKNAGKVLNGLVKKAEDGDVTAIKLYFELIYKWSPKKIVVGEGLGSKTLNITFGNPTNKEIEQVAKILNPIEDAEIIDIEPIEEDDNQ